MHNKTTENAANPKPTFWFDKDGVLAEYDYSIYLAETGCQAPWLTKNAHVFRHLPANKQMVKAFRRLYVNLQDVHPFNWPYEMKILTSVSDSVTLSEQVLDSWRWLKKKIPDLKERDFYAVATPKQDIPVVLRTRITPMDVLIDDYNKNLEAWKAAGGTAVKALNGLNSRNNAYLNVDITKPAQDIIDWFLNLAKCLSEQGNLDGQDLGYLEAFCRNRRPALDIECKQDRRKETL